MPSNTSTATLQIIPSRDVKVSGLLGPAAAIEKARSPAVADTSVGMGGTNAWRLAGGLSFLLKSVLHVALTIVNRAVVALQELMQALRMLCSMGRAARAQCRLAVNTDGVALLSRRGAGGEQPPGLPIRLVTTFSRHTAAPAVAALDLRSAPAASFTPLESAGRVHSHNQSISSSISSSPSDDVSRAVTCSAHPCDLLRQQLLLCSCSAGLEIHGGSVL